MKSWAIIGTTVLGLGIFGGQNANAQWGYGGSGFYGGNYGGYRGGYGNGANYGYRPYGGYGGYGGYSNNVWHNTSHYDYVPGGFVPHRNHFHYQPGGLYYHQSGHWDTIHHHH